MTNPADSVNINRSVSESEPNIHTTKLIISAVNSVQAIVSTTDSSQVTADPRAELDSHANIAVLRKYTYIFESTGKTCNVKPFMDDLGMVTDIPVVDGALAYDCPYTRETRILIIHNALCIKSMETNLIPPFIMRKGGIIVSDVPKIHCSDPSKDDHCITFSTCNLHIPLQLIGIFSYFHTRKPLSQELIGKDKIFITPDSSN